MEEMEFKMNIIDRITKFNDLFEDLQSTTSRLDKEYTVHSFFSRYPELQTDWEYILETLAGKHPIGFTFNADTAHVGVPECYGEIKLWIMRLEAMTPKTNENIAHIQHIAGSLVGKFLEPIVNRTLRLGIGRSLLEPGELSPMLAKKFEPDKAPIFNYIVTEKLNGNRCIAYYDEISCKWNFVSRSCKPLKIKIDMTGLPLSYIYDGELLSYDQTQQSLRRTYEIQNEFDLTEMSEFEASREFSKTTGMVNDNSTDHFLVYNIFDIVNSNEIAEKRKEILAEISKNIKYAYPQVRILPVLYKGKDFNIIKKLLDNITFSGGEGVMLNQPFMSYLHKRTDALLKYKKVKTMDMMVIDVYEGTGKYEMMAGGIRCRLITDDGRVVNCNVGSGLSDAQRDSWYQNPNSIIGSVVEIGYQAISQNKNSSDKEYSLQFPRLLKVRKDKIVPSEY